MWAKWCRLLLQVFRSLCDCSPTHGLDNLAFFLSLMLLLLLLFLLLFLFNLIHGLRKMFVLFIFNIFLVCTKLLASSSTIGRLQFVYFCWQGNHYRPTKIPLQSVRPFKYKDVSLMYIYYIECFLLVTATDIWLVGRSGHLQYLSYNHIA